MKILKLCVLFVIGSLIIGIGNAFNTNLEEVNLDEIYETTLKIDNNQIVFESEKIDESNEKQIVQKKDVEKKASNSNNNNKTSSRTTKSNKTKSQTNKKQTTSSSEGKKEETKEDTIVDKQNEETKTKCDDFYESITHGNVDKSSKSACVTYGNKIQNNELDAVLDYNEEHGNTKKPTISYYRCYEVVDSNCNTKGWYLHFFCSSSECNDKKLKSLYG